MVELPWAYIEVMDRDSCVVQQAYPVEDALGRPGLAAFQPLTSVWKGPLEVSRTHFIIIRKSSPGGAEACAIRCRWHRPGVSERAPAEDKSGAHVHRRAPWNASVMANCRTSFIAAPSQGRREPGVVGNECIV